MKLKNRELKSLIKTGNKLFKRILELEAIIETSTNEYQVHEAKRELEHLHRTFNVIFDKVFK